MRGICGIVSIIIAGAIAFGSVTAANASSRQQAVRTAREYLHYQPFSFKGLVGQLRFAGFSTSDARYGASHSGANWFREAFLAAMQYPFVQAPFMDARHYLLFQTFPRSGLAAQLRFEGFTCAQVLYAAQRVGL